MNTTRAMLVIGILMLVLAVIVAQGLRPDEPATTAGPMISGSVSLTPENPPSETDDGSTPGGMLVPLDTGTLKMDSTTPAEDLPPVSPTEQVKAETDNAGAGTPAASTANQAVTGQTGSAQAATGQTGATSTAGQTKTPPKQQTPAQNKNLVVVTSAPKTLAPGQKAISRTRLELGSRSATFRLTGVSDLKGKAFALKEPERIVVDLDGPWAVNLGKTPNNTLIKSVRAGNQEANTRLVFDLHRTPRSFKLVQVAPKTLELQIR